MRADWQAISASRRLATTSSPRPKNIFGRTSLWTVFAQLASYPHARPLPPGCPSSRDTAEAQLHTVWSRAQVLDVAGQKGGCPHRGAVLIYYDYV
jgi:hypothetical protein